MAQQLRHGTQETWLCGQSIQMWGSSTGSIQKNFFGRKNLVKIMPNSFWKNLVNGTIWLKHAVSVIRNYFVMCCYTAWCHGSVLVHDGDVIITCQLQWRNSIGNSQCRMHRMLCQAKIIRHEWKNLGAALFIRHFLCHFRPQATKTAVTNRKNPGRLG